MTEGTFASDELGSRSPRVEMAVYDLGKRDLEAVREVAEQHVEEDEWSEGEEGKKEIEVIPAREVEKRNNWSMVW